MVRLQFPNSDVDDVLRLYENLTGKKLVRDNFVQGKVNIFVAKDVPRDEAIKIIEINLLMNGFSLIPAEGDIVKVIGTGKNPRTTGVPIISDPAQFRTGITSSAFFSSCATPIRKSCNKSWPISLATSDLHFVSRPPEIVESFDHGKFERHPHHLAHHRSGRHSASGSGERVHSSATS